MQRMTKQRQAVFNNLSEHRDFRSAQKVFEDLTARGHKIGLATVYRNLQALAEDHQVDVLRSAEGEALYRKCDTQTHHHHLVCRNCGRAEDLGAGELEKWISAVAASHGYTQIEHSIELFGLCSECTRKADS
ncbi:Fur family transcriptional regulator [Actinomyces sp.]